MEKNPNQVPCQSQHELAFHGFCPVRFDISKPVVYFGRRRKLSEQPDPKYRAEFDLGKLPPVGTAWPINAQVPKPCKALHPHCANHAYQGNQGNQGSRTERKALLCEFRTQSVDLPPSSESRLQPVPRRHLKTENLKLKTLCNQGIQGNQAIPHGAQRIALRVPNPVSGPATPVRSPGFSRFPAAI